MSTLETGVAVEPRQDVKKVRDILQRIAVHAIRARVSLERLTDTERAIDEACLRILDAERLVTRARVMLIRNPELRADALEELPPEPET